MNYLSVKDLCYLFPLIKVKKNERKSCNMKCSKADSSEIKVVKSCDKISEGLRRSLLARQRSALQWQFCKLATLLFFHLNPFKISILGRASCLTKNRLFYIHLKGGLTVLPSSKNRHWYPDFIWTYLC